MHYSVWSHYQQAYEQVSEKFYEATKKIAKGRKDLKVVEKTKTFLGVKCKYLKLEKVKPNG